MALPTLDQISKARTEARQFGDGTTYALDFNVNGNSYTFIPKNVASNGGVTAGNNTYLLPFFTDEKNWETFNKSASEYDLSSSGLANYLKNQGQSTTGYLVPSSSVSFDSEVRTQPTSTLGGSLAVTGTSSLTGAVSIASETESSSVSTGSIITEIGRAHV